MYISAYTQTHIPTEQCSSYSFFATYSVISYRWAADSVAFNAQNRTSTGIRFSKPIEQCIIYSDGQYDVIMLAFLNIPTRIY
jgi:hypothetical protein